MATRFCVGVSGRRSRRHVVTKLRMFRMSSGSQRTEVLSKRSSTCSSRATSFWVKRRIGSTDKSVLLTKHASKYLSTSGPKPDSDVSSSSTAEESPLSSSSGSLDDMNLDLEPEIIDESVVAESDSDKVPELETTPQPIATFIVGLDGRAQGYLALDKAFQLSSTFDRILGVHIPVEKYEIAYELMPHLGELILSANDSAVEPLQLKRDEYIDLMLNNAAVVGAQYNEKHIDFQMVFGDDSLTVKEDLVDACGEFESDYLVLGSPVVLEGKSKKFIGRVLGSVSDYCVQRAPCTVIIVKEPLRKSDTILDHLATSIDQITRTADGEIPSSHP